jgi:hypothetical protein
MTPSSTASAGRYRCRPKRGVGATFASLAALRGKIAPDLASPEERGFLLAMRERESDRSSSIEALDGKLTDIRQLASMIAESFAVVAFHKMRRGVEPSGVCPQVLVPNTWAPSNHRADRVHIAAFAPVRHGLLHIAG